MRERLLALAEEADDVDDAVIVGSLATGSADEWSDIDLALSVPGDVDAALARWTEILYADFAAVHHWDLPWGSSIYRVFLLPSLLEVDLSFTPAADFVIGKRVPPDARELIGMAWHHLMHARTCIARGKRWEAEWFLSAARDHVLSLACLRLGYPARFAKGTDALPADVTRPVEAALVRSLEDAELRRALAAASAAYEAELERNDAELAARLRPLFAELT